MADGGGGGGNLFRAVGGTEYSWCKAVPGGTGITVLALLVSKKPDESILQNALHALQASHPILNTKLHLNPATNTFSFLSHDGPTPNLRIQPFDLQSTAEILRRQNDNETVSVSPFHLILEHELNRNSWKSPNDTSHAESAGVFFASLYCLSESQWALALRLHTAACDRTAASALLRELVRTIGGGGAESGIEGSGEGSLGIEEAIPKGKGEKPFWARGVDMLGYSLNSFRLSNLEFRDAISPRLSLLVRLRMSRPETQRLLEVSDFTFVPFITGRKE